MHASICSNKVLLTLRQLLSCPFRLAGAYLGVAVANMGDVVDTVQILLSLVIIQVAAFCAHNVQRLPAFVHVSRCVGSQRALPSLKQFHTVFEDLRYESRTY